MAQRSVTPRPPDVMSMAFDSILTEQLTIERGHKRGLAAAASMVEVVWLEIDGTVLERSAAYEIARRAVHAYIQQVARVTEGERR